MGNTQSMNIEYNGNLHQVSHSRFDYASIIQNIKSQLGIQNPFTLKIKGTDQEWNEEMYLQQNFFQLSQITFVLIEQTQFQLPIKKKNEKSTAVINPKQLLNKGLYLKYFRQKQRTYYKQPKSNQFDQEENKFVDMQVYGLKYQAHYKFMNEDFIKFLHEVMYHEKCNYSWVNAQSKELFLLRSIEIFDFEDNFQKQVQKQQNNSIQFEIIRQNRVKVYSHYYYFGQICQRYQMESYQKLLNNQLTEPNYQKCVLQFISSFIGDEQLNQKQIKALIKYFKPLDKPDLKCKTTFLQQIQSIVSQINYEPPTLDYNPMIGISLDENIKIDDTLSQLTNNWMHSGPFYDIHLTKQALYDAKYIMFLYNKYATSNLDTIVDSINFQLVQN
ncbi:hypothetical protein pb186bvf_005383 [Paramecium bursaria]